MDSSFKLSDRSLREFQLPGVNPEPSAQHPLAGSSSGPSQAADDPDSDEPGPPPPPVANEPDGGEEGQEEPEYDPDQDFDNELPQLPITHELILKDHTKVVSALTLDPSGARILSGSHDYDCKLWDFGGLDWRGKPFKSWEPAGSYHVRFIC